MLFGFSRNLEMPDPCGGRSSGPGAAQRLPDWRRRRASPLRFRVQYRQYVPDQIANELLDRILLAFSWLAGES